LQAKRTLKPPAPASRLPAKTQQFNGEHRQFEPLCGAYLWKFGWALLNLAHAATMQLPWEASEQVFPGL